MPTVQSLQALQHSLGEGLFERQTAIRLSLLAALAGEHLLLIGPPGTAKSLLARRLHLAFKDATYFERLLTRFSVPEELLGPLSLAKLEQGEYHRLTEGYLPKAAIAFLDEIFKANSAILNALLTLLNEREFDNGVVREKTPLISVVAASNELPDEELAALLDRFLLRLYVGPISADAFDDMLNAPEIGKTPSLDPALQLTQADLDQVRQQSQQVPLADDVHGFLRTLREWCAEQKIIVSDRRWVKAVGLLKVSAHTNGRSEVSAWDCWLLSHCLWNKPEEQAKLHHQYTTWIGASKTTETGALVEITTTLEGLLEEDKATVPKKDAKGRPLFRVSYSGGTEKEEPLYHAPDDAHDEDGDRCDRTDSGDGWLRSQLDDMRLYINYNWIPFKDWDERAAYLADPENCLRESSTFKRVLVEKRYSQGHIKERVGMVDEQIQALQAQQDLLEARIAAIESDLKNHLWVEEAFCEPASQHLRKGQAVFSKLRARLEAVKGGFQGLPLEETNLPTKS